MKFLYHKKWVRFAKIDFLMGVFNVCSQRLLKNSIHPHTFCILKIYKDKN